MRVTTRDKAIDYLQRKVENFRTVRSPSILFVRRASGGISASKGRLGIFPASFNPPTKAHVALVRKAREQYDLDEILVLLDLQAMDKWKTGASIADRLMMLKILFQRNPNVSIGLSNRGRFLDKLKPLKTIYPSPVTFTFIVGFDTIIRIMDRKYYVDRGKSLGQLFKESRFIVGSRGKRDQRSFEKLFQNSGNKKYSRRVSFLILPMEFSSVSSSLVRNRLRDCKPVNDFVPLSVLRFIEKTGLYAKEHQHGNT